MKHIVKKYLQWIIGLGIFLGGVTTVYIVVAQVTTELRWNDQLTTQFGSTIFVYRADIDFKYGGNQKIGTYMPRTAVALSSPESVTLSGGVTGLCYSQIRGIYYNNERGERARPLDQNTLTGLQAIDTSYSGLQLAGGFFTNCTGLGGTSANVYGQITMTYHTTVYYLMAGTTYNFPANIHGSSLSGSLEFTNNVLSGYLWDSYGGIGEILGSSGCVDARSPAPDTVCSGTVFTQTSVCGNTQTLTGTMFCNGWTGKIINPLHLNGLDIFTGSVQISGFTFSGFVFHSTGGFHVISTGSVYNSLIINASGLTIRALSGTWDGTLIPPTAITGGDTRNAVFGESGLPVQTGGSTTRAILLTVQAGATTDSLVASGSLFRVNFVVSAGIAGNTLKIYRSEDGTTWTPNTPDLTCILDSDLVCSFDTDHFSYFAPIKETTVSSSSYGGSNSLVRDDCVVHTTPSLSGSNADGIDYSPSYYDHTCEGPKSTLQRTGTSLSCSIYTAELNRAYLFARSFDITTIDQCKNVNIKGHLIRKDLAKMMVNFAENVFGRTGVLVDDDRCTSFDDISQETSSTKAYIQKACAYGLMGLEPDGVTPSATFSPNGKINRAQFGTILSRFIWGSLNNTDDKTLYYSKHLKALQSIGIMKKIDTPTMQELRGWVMLTMQRIYTKTK